MIAIERIDGMLPTGERVDILAGIGAPYEVGPQEWACSVCLDGLHKRLGDIHGASSLQAFCLAASLLRRLLMHFVEEGGTLKCPGTGNPFDIEATFSGVGATERGPA